VLDEVHRLQNPSELLKIAADHFPSVHVLATGSSTLQATAKFRDTLTGRKAEIWLTPMTVTDLEDFGSTDLVRRLWRGGLPGFFLAEEVTEADFQEWVDSYWAKDVQELFRLERRASFVRFVELVLARSGGVFEATAFSAACEVSRPTIANYLSVLEATRIAHVVRPYSARRSIEIVASPRVYGFDTGFVRSFRGWIDPRPDDLGLLWEHYVLNELQAQGLDSAIRYWRSTHHHEVDFVVVSKGHPPAAVECKWTVDGTEDLRGIKAFRRIHQRGENFVVAANVHRPFTRRLGPLRVEYVGLSELIQNLRSPQAPAGGGRGGAQRNSAR